jgi:hypothetical protein
MTAWPPVEPERLADAVELLADRVEERDVRAQLNALAAVLRNVGRESEGEAERQELQRALAERPDDLDVLRRLAALNRAAVRPVDWSAVTGG